MPTPTRYKRNDTLYRTNNLYGSDRLYSRTSTAYDIPVRYPEHKVKPSIKPDVKKKTSIPDTRQKSAASRAKVTRMVILAGILFVLCITVLYRYGIILSCNQQIKQLEAQKNEILSSNQAAQTKIDKQFEMNEIEKYAEEKLGMMKPQPYQIFYIDMQMGDEGGKGTVSNAYSGALTGVPGMLVNAFKVLK